MDCILHIIWRGRYLTEEYFKVLKFWINLGFFVCLLELYRRCSIWEPRRLECWKENVLLSKPLLHIFVVVVDSSTSKPIWRDFSVYFQYFQYFSVFFCWKGQHLKTHMARISESTTGRVKYSRYDSGKATIWHHLKYEMILYQIRRRK